MGELMWFNPKPGLSLKTLLLISLLLGMAACVSGPATPPSGGTFTPATTLPKLTPLPSLPPNGYPAAPTATPAIVQPYPPPPATPTAVAAYPAAEPSPAPGEELVGLVFANPEGVWLIEGAARQRQLTIRPNALLSPDLTLAAYFESGDLWLQDLTNGAIRNLTFTPDREECCVLHWWAAQPDRLLIAYRSAGDDAPNRGTLALINLADGSEITPAPDAPAFSEPALSPDGRTLAFDMSGAAALYTLGGQAAPLDLGNFTWQNGAPPDILGIGSPAWSPDGQHLAWYVTLNDAGENKAAILILDLTRRAAQIIHPYVNLGRGGWFSPPVWSPDGRWLAFVVEAAAEGGVWVAAADGSAEEYLGPGSDPLWRYDGQRLIYAQDQNNFQLIATGDWTATPVTLPDSTLQAWPTLQP